MRNVGDGYIKRTGGAGKDGIRQGSDSVVDFVRDPHHCYFRHPCCSPLIIYKKINCLIGHFIVYVFQRGLSREDFGLSFAVLSDSDPVCRLHQFLMFGVVSAKIYLTDKKLTKEVICMKPEFRKRLMTMILIVLAFSVMNTVFKHWIFSSIGFCVSGLLCIIKPVKISDFQPEKKQFMECRIAGVILILLGIMLRARLY